MKYALAAACTALALFNAAPAHADEQDSAFLYTLLKEGIIIGDPDAALGNVAKICGAASVGYPVDAMASEIDANEPGLDFVLSKTFVLTALQFYCPPDALYKTAL
jgi:Protein of unknown function (DUF732)